MTTPIEAAAARLRDAYANSPVDPLRDILEAADINNAYAIQSHNTKHWLKQGRRIVGRKVGLTAKSVQAQLGVGQPDFGVLFDDMQVQDGGILSPDRLIQGKVEAEIALILDRDLDGDKISHADVWRATAYVVPALEIVDSRIKDWKITFADTVSDNASAAYFVLGSTPFKLDGLDLRTCGMVLEIDDQIVSMGAGAACLGHPLNAATWLAQTLSRRGDPLRAGDIVLTGALGPMVTLTPDTYVRASIGGLGSVGFFFR